MIDSTFSGKSEEFLQNIKTRLCVVLLPLFTEALPLNLLHFFKCGLFGALSLKTWKVTQESSIQWGRVVITFRSWAT